MFEHAEKNKWFETYWFYDIHGVISQPDYRKESKEINYYPYVKFNNKGGTTLVRQAVALNLLFGYF